jgi:plastocyanin
MRRGVLFGLLGLVLVLGSVACSNGGSSNGGQPAGSIKVTMSDYKFSPSTVTAKSGKVTIFLVNSGSVSHDMVVMSSDGTKTMGRSDLIQPSDSGELTISDLAAGSYPFICDQPGHAALGMKGTLTVS